MRNVQNVPSTNNSKRWTTGQDWSNDCLTSSSSSSWQSMQCPPNGEERRETQMRIPSQTAQREPKNSHGFMICRSDSSTPQLSSTEFNSSTAWATVPTDWPDHSLRQPHQPCQQEQLRRRWRRHMLWVHSIKITSWLCYMHPGPVPVLPFLSFFTPPLRILLISTENKIMKRVKSELTILMLIYRA